jgi:hypothetical protein
MALVMGIMTDLTGIIVRDHRLLLPRHRAFIMGTHTRTAVIGLHHQPMADAMAGREMPTDSTGAIRVTDVRGDTVGKAIGVNTKNRY